MQTGDISGSYNSSGNFKGYNLNANINADSIKNVDSSINTYLSTLTPAEYAAFSLGTFEGSASSKLKAQGFGGGYGITNKLTVYGFIPFYSAEVNMRIIRTAKGQTTAGSLLQLSNLPDVDTRLIQSLVVNYFGYKPLGTWKATDFGDAELGFLYQIKKVKDAGLLVSAGAVIPTGRRDDPDVLQDIPFGDGQWDAFVEAGGGVTLSQYFSLDSWTRLTWQFPYRANIRLPESQTFPVTTRKGMTDIKLGNKILTNIQASLHFSDQWMTSVVYTLEYKEADKYKSPYAISDSILKIDSEKNSQTAKINLNYSTVALYQKKKFLAPLSLNLSGQTIFTGKNVPYYRRFDFEVALFF